MKKGKKGKGLNLGGMGMDAIMEQAQRMTQQMQAMKDEVAKKTVEATAGGGMITVIARGDQTIQSITISPEVVDPDDVDMLQDLVMAAVNEALRKATEMMSDEMGKITGGLGMNIPGLF